MNSARRTFVFLIASIPFVLLCSCMQGNNNPQDIGTWSFSGVVVDGASGRGLDGVVISYMDEDGEQQNDEVYGDGKFYISGLPFGERTFVFTCTDSDNEYTSIRVTAASWAESSTLGGVIGDISRIVKLYPLSGSVSGNLVYQPKETEYQVPATGASIRIIYQDSTMVSAQPSLFTTATDSSGSFEISGLPLAPGCVIIFDDFVKKEVTYTLPAEAITLFSEMDDLGKMVYTTTDTTRGTPRILISNVLSIDGFGKTGVPVNETVWYILPVALEPGTVLASMNGFGPPFISTRISDDTLFLIPVAQMVYDTLIEVSISGVTEDNEKFALTLDGNTRFRTEKCPFPVEANFWSQPWIMSGRFGTGEPLWVRFSEPLDTVLNTVNWAVSSAGTTIYGAGSEANAKFRIKKDTLFIEPDQRLNLIYNSTMGFNVQLRAVDGRYLQFYDFGVNTIEDPLYVVWTNTRDLTGKNRNDMGLRDTLRVVASVSGFKVLNSSVGDSGIIPPGLMLSDITVSGDTIVCVPPLSLQSDTAYSIDFDVQLTDGSIRRDVLGMQWSTKSKVTIIGTDTKVNGMYRPLAAIGDSFTVSFSEAIDTSTNATVAFRVNIVDVNDRIIRSKTRWRNKCCTAVITVIDTLPTADFDAPAAYTATATFTKAVESVTFDLVTKSGEQALRCRPEGDPISLHTEKGMCIVFTNCIPELDRRISVGPELTPTREFPLEGNVVLEFSRIIDTSALKMDSLSLYAAIHKIGAVIVPAKVTLQKDLKTIVINPEEDLEMKTEYYVWIKGIPAKGITGAAPINNHGGTFSGKSGSSYLFERPFRTQ